MDTVFVVRGQTGEYSDHIEWLVCAYDNKELAEEHVRLAEARSSELAAWVCPVCEERWRYHYAGKKCPNKPLNQYDHDFYTGTTYDVLEVTARKSLPTNESP